MISCLKNVESLSQSQHGLGMCRTPGCADCVGFFSSMLADLALERAPFSPRAAPTELSIETPLKEPMADLTVSPSPRPLATMFANETFFWRPS